MLKCKHIYIHKHTHPRIHIHKENRDAHTRACNVHIQYIQTHGITTTRGSTHNCTHEHIQSHTLALTHTHPPTHMSSFIFYLLSYLLPPAVSASPLHLSSSSPSLSHSSPVLPLPLHPSFSPLHTSSSLSMYHPPFSDFSYPISVFPLPSVCLLDPPPFPSFCFLHLPIPSLSSSSLFSYDIPSSSYRDISVIFSIYPPISSL